MDLLIRKRSTGNPEDFAARLSVSERSLYNYLTAMRELGAPICYSRVLGSYYYRTDGKFTFEFKKVSEPEYAF